MTRTTIGAVGALTVAIALTALAVGCGDDGDGDGSQGSVDAAFVAAMQPHHEMAIDMAETAQQRADHAQIRRLAADIIDAQTAEIETMEEMETRLGGDGEMMMLGLSDEEMGMDMNTHVLESAKPFDRAFIDAMIAHHQGAIRMARVELADGSDEDATALANAIVEAQSEEIERMDAWRMRWYGAPSPAGGVPPEGESQMDDGSMDMDDEPHMDDSMDGM